LTAFSWFGGVVVREVVAVVELTTTGGTVVGVGNWGRTDGFLDGSFLYVKDGQQTLPESSGQDPVELMSSVKYEVTSTPISSFIMTSA
jgi:hypothetical protein